MSHAHSKAGPVNCPNCGFPATHNYCAQCGQETHIHKETFWGLVLHFVAHYFHYDSKFWQTLKTLWTKPGALTVAYWEQKRNRFIPPISLYIFVSAVFFLLFFSTAGSHEALVKEIKEQSILHPVSKEDTATKVTVVKTARGTTTTTQVNFGKIIYDPKFATQFWERIAQNLPKFFFFMIPFMAFLLKLLYSGRKENYFVDHAVFSLHVHAFIFSIFIFSLPPYPDAVNTVIGVFLSVIVVVYMMIALHRAYGSGWVASVVRTFVLVLGYAIVTALILGGYTAFAVFSDFLSKTGEVYP